MRGYAEGPMLCRMTRHQSVWWAKFDDGSTEVWVEEVPKTWAVRAFFKTANPGSAQWAALINFDANERYKSKHGITT